jgi:hypothetical protein
LAGRVLTDVVEVDVFGDVLARDHGGRVHITRRRRSDLAATD